MRKILITVLVISAVAAFVLISHRSLFMRTVNYEIAGVQIPSKYNMLTGKVTPIKNYTGRADLPAMQPSIKGNLGLGDEQAQAAKLRWALFEEWVSQMPQYSDWQTDPESFKKAMSDFKKFVSG